MRLVALLALIPLILQAAAMEARYAISYSFLGRIGTSTLHFSSDNGRYRIKAEARLEGIAALLARHHTEHHTSSGRIDSRGHLIPERYDTLRSMDGYRRAQHYRFDRRHRRITFEEKTQRMVSTRHFDTKTLRYTTVTSPENRTDYGLIHSRADNDLLTLYFNARGALKRMMPSSRKRIATVGSRNGSVLIVKQDAPSEFIVHLDQDIFRSKEGIVHVRTDDAYFIKRLILKDVFLFGDLEVEREWLRQSP